MGLLSDLRLLYHLTLKPIRGGTHAARLESFYRGQAQNYDAFRRRLLPGRDVLCSAIDAPRDGIWVDMGGGTGASLEYLGERLQHLSKVYVVDLSPSLLAVANARIAQHGWQRVQTVEADATVFRPEEGYADVVTFSYSLTMIPDWFAAVEHALSLLRVGGLLGVVDFYVARKHPVDGLVRHGWWTRHFWPAWFAADNVFLSPDHVPFLHRHLEVLHFEQRRAKVPYLPWVRAPYYTFVGRKLRSVG
jgi:S-adenosylmethionine-diacylgycerolhomoserine-N-methlytransferase